MTYAWMLNTVQVGMSLASFLLAVYAVKNGLANWRPYHAAVAVLSIVSLGAYLYLIIWEPPMEDWAVLMRGVSLLSWPLVWGWGSILSVKNQQTVNRLAKVVKDYEP